MKPLILMWNTDQKPLVMILKIFRKLVTECQVMDRCSPLITYCVAVTCRTHNFIDMATRLLHSMLPSHQCAAQVEGVVVALPGSISKLIDKKALDLKKIS